MAAPQPSREKFSCDLRGRNIKLLGVFLHHPLRVEDRRDAADRFAHQLQPGEGKFAVRFRVIERNDLVLEQLIKTARVHFVLKFGGAIVDLGADGPAVVAVVTFAPPAIEHAQIDSAIRRRFHSAGAARFQADAADGSAKDRLPARGGARCSCRSPPRKTMRFSRPASRLNL